MKKLILIIMPLLFIGYAHAQTTIDSLTVKTIVANTEKTVALTKTGAANDVLTNAYKIAIKNIFGNKKDASYSSTIYGTIRLFNPKFGSGADYLNTRWARNIE